jgi:asparagine synthase (glutamine-hydrolysing)
MCGIVGILRLKNNSEILDEICNLNNSILHRGPDEGAVYVSHNNNLALGHRRLAILDLTSTGSQPMASVSGDLVMVFNGEIYNYLDIKNQLVAEFGELDFRGTSDTEVLLCAIERWGTKKALEKCNGMFALAVWSNLSQTLTLCRDRFGEKPLYYCQTQSSIVFSSELTGLESYFKGELELDLESVALFFKYTYVPGGNCIYKGVKKLKPGHFVVFNGNNLCEVEYSTYWSSSERFLNSNRYPFKGNYNEAKRVLNEKFELSVRNMMCADVQVGAFLSGGVDSAAVVSKMTKFSHQKIQTFSMGFDGSDYDERDDARRISSQFKTEHHEFGINESDIIEIASNLSMIYDEPFADSSQVPTVLISRFARNEVKVALTGDGGDEFLGGYPRHAQFISAYNAVQGIPRDFRRVLGSGLGLGLKSVSFMNELRPSLAPGIRQLEKLKSLLLYDLNGYWDWVTHWRTSDDLVNSYSNHHFPLNVDFDTLIASSGIEKTLMYFDSQTYLIDEILVKVDRGTMSNSLETRAPFLDHDLVEFCWSLQSDMLNNGSMRKILLRDIVEDEIRPLKLKKHKSGFSIPLGTWLRNGLKPWAIEILDYKPGDGSILNESIIKKVWNQHQEGRKDLSPLIWSVLMFKSWCKTRNI